MKSWAYVLHFALECSKSINVRDSRYLKYFPEKLDTHDDYDRISKHFLVENVAGQGVGSFRLTEQNCGEVKFELQNYFNVDFKSMFPGDVKIAEITRFSIIKNACLDSEARVYIKYGMYKAVIISCVKWGIAYLVVAAKKALLKEYMNLGCEPLCENNEIIYEVLDKKPHYVLRYDVAGCKEMYKSQRPELYSFFYVDKLTRIEF